MLKHIQTIVILKGLKGSSHPDWRVMVPHPMNQLFT